jgi:diguanylate cyclase (GGDEF)-like protein
MNQENSQDYGASPLLRRFILLLGIVFAAELIVIAAILLSGGGLSGADLAASIVRVLLVALSGWFLLLRDGSDEPRQAQPIVDVTVPNAAPEPQVWPNIDPLTHTSNQRGLTIHMLEMMALAERYSHRLSLCLIRISGLDEFSPEQREDALITVSTILSELVRIPDKVGRYEEALFMVIMPEADYAGASLVASRLQSSLEKEIGDKATINMGVAEFERGDDLQRLLARAQQALE